ncbi:concanavalin A-like lectin/glucanase domain-containing protein [Irpex rosettiformis]|uniref:Concanavalin A-like lectin/glucanase domain-containing protein n=1 Tax=Irpex rosettiformis TaxID=378272 RepID=A0ACB8U7V9_9APHY|nr:concanavalin A-like lectin/glucanase domain-containing protein [Irpex rosettiformis]
MRLHLPLLLCLFTTISPADANIFARGTESFARIASKAHRHAARRSAGLARDLRLSFQGLLAEQPQGAQSVANSRVYCVNSPGLSSNTNNNDTSPAIGNATTVISGPSFTSSSGGKASGTASSGRASATASSAPSSPWKLKQSYQGNSFFNGWDFFTGADPTNGIVTYIDQNTAKQANLISINSDGNAVMKVETTPQVQNTRQSVRITTQLTFTGGLVIMDSVHMPTGCGTWPAFWTNGPNWPNNGEIDIVEGVNDYTNNQATIHTAPGCTLSSSSSSALGISGTLVGGTVCAAALTGNQGCGVRSPQTNSFGASFNSNNGGVYAMQWDNDGVSVFFFPRNNIPDDITANAPLPQNWGTPMAFWPSANCDPFKFFNGHSAIFDTTLCGDWASGVWTSSGIPGQEQSCAQRTGVSTCEQFVRQNGGSFSEAYWEVSYVKIFQTS